ncbi:MAG TPA: Hsp20/alpha crystallin family protein [Candidatus Butyricicoccus stercorigallinarum]|nr:Hsp20/alpha crystallin family protein [Candidatus Butyricicoccus stercorigallinarum]
MFGMIPFEYRDRNLFNVFDNFERSFFGNSSVDLPAFRADIRDAGDKYLLDAELPGFQKEDISLDIKDGILTISAEHNENSDQKDDKGNYIRRERRYGAFRRSFDISGIDEDAISASYQNGILELSLPKAQQVLPQSRRIAIE